MKNSIQRISTVSKATFIECYRDRILYNFVVVAILLLMLSFVVSNLTFGFPARVALHFGSMALTLSSVAIAIFIGVGLVNKELEKRTIYTLVSKPLMRWEFLLGKFIGLAGILFLNIAFLFVIQLLLLKYYDFEIPVLIFQSCWLQFLEALVILSVALFFSTITGSTLSAIFSVAVFLAGRGLSIAEAGKPDEMGSSLYYLISFFKVFFPDLNRLNLQNIVWYSKSVPIGDFLAQSAYGIGYSAILLFASAIAFSRRDFS